MEFRFDANNYEFNKKSEKAVYLLHGFSSTTYEVKDLAQYLAKNGYHTIAKNLPGHGTSPEECNSIKFHHWLDFIKKDIAQLSNKAEKIYVVGNSMGGVLSLYLASFFPIDAYVAAGTVLKFKSFFNTNILVPLLCNFVPFQKKTKVLKHKNAKFYGYKEYPLKALNEYRKMIYVVLKRIHYIKIPGLIIHSHPDQTSSKKNVDIILKHINNNKTKTLFVDRAHHNMFDENLDQNIIFENILSFLNNN